MNQEEIDAAKTGVDVDDLYKMRIPDVTAEQLQQSCIKNNITRIPCRECSICNVQIAYEVENGNLYFDSACDCAYGPRTPRHWDNAADWVNMQTDPKWKIDFAMRFGVQLITPRQLRGNIRHDIAHALVAAQIEKKIAEYEALRRTAPNNGEDTEAVNARIDGYIAKERDYYGTVRVIELPQDSKFILVYGDVDDATVDTGTGPFATLAEAQDWFLKSGR